MVERNRLIELAPQYYELTLCNFFRANKTASSSTLWESTQVGHGPTFWHGLNKLVEQGVLTVVLDDFGPNIYSKADAFDARWKAITERPGSPGYKYKLDPKGDAWLAEAMKNVNAALKEQNIKQEEFSNPDAEWAPLPVERASEKLQKATNELEKTIQAVEADNGYSANLPDERKLVVENLKDAVQKLKTEDSVSFGYLKRKAINTLDILIRRFGAASVGLVAQAARAALMEWLKDLGGKALHWII